MTHWELSTETSARINTAGLLVRRSPVSIKGFVDDDFGIRLNVMAYIGGTPEERAIVPVGQRSDNRYPNARFVDCCNWDTDTPYWHDRYKDEITILANCSYGTLEGDVGNSAGIQGIQFRVHRRTHLRGCAGNETRDGTPARDVPPRHSDVTAAYQYIYVIRGLSKTDPGGHDVVKDVTLAVPARRQDRGL